MARHYTPRAKIPVEVRFWKYVNKMPGENACWIWTGTILNRAKYGTSGYGMIGGVKRGEFILAHRLSYEIAYGPIPEGMQVLHNCPGKDNRACVNPNHLWLGDNEANMKDAAKKGSFLTRPQQWKSGNENPRAKLRESQVLQIPELLKEKTVHEIAQMFNVTPDAIRLIVRGKNWAYLNLSIETV